MTDTSITGTTRAAYGRWIDALSALATPRPKPRSWRILAFHTPQSLEVFLHGPTPQRLGTFDHAAAPDARAQTTTALGKATAPHQNHVLLRLSSGDVLERTMQIPRAASDVIEAVLTHQMDRLIPWSREETHYGWRVIGSNAQAPEQMDVQVVATPRRLLEAALARARALGLAPYAVDFAPDPRAPGIELLSLERDPRTRTAAILHMVCMGVLGTALVAGSAGAYQAWDRRAQFDDLQVRVSQAKSRLAAIEARGKLDTQHRQEREQLIHRRLGEPAAVVVIEALARALPDDAFLTDLEIRGREARIAGKSPDPTELITRLENAAQFEGVTFAAPTIREETTGLRAFSITANTVPQPLEEGRR